MLPVRTVLLAAALLAAPALAAPQTIPDRPPTAEERTAIEAKLRELGFVSWDEIELDDNGTVWEIDDARTADGAKYEVRLKPGTLDLIRRDRDR